MAKRRNKRTRTVCLLLATAAAIGGMMWYRGAALAIPTVKTAAVTVGVLETTAVCTGTVQAADGTGVYVSTPCVAGRVAVKEGDRVKAGDVLLEVDRSATLSMAIGAGMTENTAVLASAALPETITAPHDGVVRAVSASQGDTLQTTSPCVMIAQNGNVEIAVVIRERLVPKIAVGQRAVVTGIAFDKSRYEGTVTSIASSARSRLVGTSSETVVDAVVTIDPDQADDSLLIGLTAKATVTVDRQEEVLLMPHDCVAYDGDGAAYVYRLNGEVAVRQAVTLGGENAQGVQVTAGLSAGDTVVVSPDLLQGETVRVRTEATL